MEYQPKLNEKYTPFLDCISSFEQLKVLLKNFLRYHPQLFYFGHYKKNKKKNKTQVPSGAEHSPFFII